MHKMCSDDSKCAVMKGYLCGAKKVIRKFGWINRNFKCRSEIGVQLLRSKCAVMNFP